MTNLAEPPNTRRNSRQRLRISLLNFLILLTVVCVVLATLGQVYRRAKGQRESVATLTEMATSENGRSQWKRYANVYYDFEIETYRAQQRGVLVQQPPSNVLAKWLGLDFVHSAELVEFQVPLDVRLACELPQLPGLKHVVLEAGIVDQAAWQQLAACDPIQELKLVFGQPDTRLKLEGLSRLSQLQVLTIVSGVLTKQNLREISKSKTLHTIRLIDVQLPRESLLGFPRMANIESFFWKIYQNPLDDETFPFIKNLPNLRKLALAGECKITDESIECLRSLSSIEEISLHGTSLTGSNLRYLQDLHHLVKLELGASKLNDVALKTISNLQHLEHLEIGSTEVTDAGMESVAKLKNLRHLSIRDTAISDAGLAKLQTLTRLRFLRLRDTKITPAGIEDFAQSHPQCLIER